MLYKHKEWNNKKQIYNKSKCVKSNILSKIILVMTIIAPWFKLRPIMSDIDVDLAYSIVLDE